MVKKIAILALIALMIFPLASAITITTFNNSLSQENITIDGSNQTRWLNVSSDIDFLTLATLNLSAWFDSQSLENQTYWDTAGGGGQSNNMTGLWYDAQDTFYIKNFTMLMAKSGACDDLDQFCAVYTDFNTGVGGRLQTGTFSSIWTPIFLSNAYYTCNLDQPLLIEAGEDYFFAFNMTFQVSNCSVNPLYSEFVNGYSEYETYRCQKNGEAENLGCTIRAQVGGFQLWRADYPNNFSLEVGDIDGDPEYNYTDYLNATNIFVNVRNAINSYLTGCTPVSGDCRVPFTFYSATKGIIEYFNLLFSNDDMIINDNNYTTPVLEGSVQEFSLNISFDGGQYTAPAAILTHNNTEYIGSTSGSGNERAYTASVTMPDVNISTNLSFYWTVFLNASDLINTTINNQTVNPLTIDGCGSNVFEFLNFTIKDEEEQATLSNTDLEIFVSIYDIARTELVTTYNTSSSNNPFGICLNDDLNGTSYSFDAIIRYEANNYAIEYYNFRNSTLTNETLDQRIDLYDLNLSDSTEFRLTFTGSDYLPVDDALVYVDRQYVSEGTFKTVELPLTDSNGQAVLHLVRNDVIYNIRIVKGGEVVGNFENIIAFCEDIITGNCEIVLNAADSTGATYDYNTAMGITFSAPVWDSGNNTVSFSFVSVDGTSKVVFMNVTRNDIFGNRSICNDVLASSSGTLECSVGNIDDTLLRVEVFVDGAMILVKTINISSRGMGDAGYLVLLAFAMSLILMFGKSKNGVLIGILISFAGAIGLSMIQSDLIGFGASGLWLVVIIVIAWWKLNKERQS